MGLIVYKNRSIGVKLVIVLFHKLRLAFVLSKSVQLPNIGAKDV